MANAEEVQESKTQIIGSMSELLKETRINLVPLTFEDEDGNEIEVPNIIIIEVPPNIDFENLQNINSVLTEYLSRISEPTYVLAYSKEPLSLSFDFINNLGPVTQYAQEENFQGILFDSSEKPMINLFATLAKAIPNNVKKWLGAEGMLACHVNKMIAQLGKWVNLHSNQGVNLDIQRYLTYYTKMQSKLILMKSGNAEHL